MNKTYWKQKRIKIKQKINELENELKNAERDYLTAKEKVKLNGQIKKFKKIFVWIGTNKLGVKK